LVVLLLTRSRAIVHATVLIYNAMRTAVLQAPISARLCRRWCRSKNCGPYLSYATSSGWAPHVRLANPGDLHRLSSHYLGVARNDGAYFPSALNSSPLVRSQLRQLGDIRRDPPRLSEKGVGEW